MSVFDDFQRLWMQRFPQSTLSDAWEQDVRASLERHRLKIAELSKELEQETLYVEYLERLLSDVEKYRASGGDPTALFEAASGSESSSNGATTSAAAVEKEFKSSLNLRESSSLAVAGSKDKDRLSLNTDNKYTHTSNAAGSSCRAGGNAGGGIIGNGSGKGSGSSGLNSAPSAGGKLGVEHRFEREDRDKDSGNEKDANGALQQCITELAASIKPQPLEGVEAERELSARLPLHKSTSQYITVIQVKEAKDKEGDEATMSSANDQQKQQQPTPPSTFSRYAGEGAGLGAEPSAPPLSPSLTSYAGHVEAKKKKPPRPRRAGKFVINPELMEELGRKMVGKMDSLEHAKRSEASFGSVSGGCSSLGRTSSTPGRTLNPGRTGAGTVGASPTRSLNKTAKLAVADSSSTSSLEKKSRSSLQASDGGGANQCSVGSKESLASQGISEVIKSYESVSSLSSESAKAPASGPHQSPADHEPYYDSVPLDNGDGEYVFIKPGRTGSSSSRDDLSTPGSSTLPMAQVLSSQTSVVDPESPGRTSNYVNIDYFLQQSNETRSSSLDSDGEYEGPPILRTISYDEQTTSQITPGALRKPHSNPNQCNTLRSKRRSPKRNDD
ncbi:GL16641 [Drosophila persimilis]|uniref:GL16641 n=1 Tax=Drosophila persimilis TaxID=7234 RepID=B4HCI0_DROPE|nr:GL16641 [Drosophila persimilis]